jgi:hypothetical protein
MPGPRSQRKSTNSATWRRGSLEPPLRLPRQGQPFEGRPEPTRLTANSRWGFEPVLRKLACYGLAGRQHCGHPGTGHPGWRRRRCRMTQDQAVGKRARDPDAFPVAAGSPNNRRLLGSCACAPRRRVRRAAHHPLQASPSAAPKFAPERRDWAALVTPDQYVSTWPATVDRSHLLPVEQQLQVLHDPGRGRPLRHVSRH